MTLLSEPSATHVAAGSRTAVGIAPTLVGDDPRDPGRWLAGLFDPGSPWPLTPRDDSGVLVSRGLIDGVDAVAYCTDATAKGGALGPAGCRRIARAINMAVTDGTPVVGLWHSGGARLTDGVAALDGVGEVFAAMVRASGRVPQISVVLGPAAGGAAYGPALTDVVVMSDDGRVFVTGPEVIRQVTGEQVDMRELGGPELHGRRSGVAHLTTRDHDSAVAAARRLVGLLGAPGAFAVPPAAGEDLTAVLPDQPNRAYDVRRLVGRLLDGAGADGAGPLELQPKWAPNIVTTLGRLAGHTVGVVANNPLRLGGCLDAASAEKAARFVRMCDAFGAPLVVLVDVPGYLPGAGPEAEGVVRRGAKLLHAFAEATVPRVTLVTRKAYGGAYIAMNSRALGATAVYAWPDAEVAVMGAGAAVAVLHRRTLAAAAPDERDELRERLIAEQERVAGGVHRAVAIGAVDEVIAPVDTRHRLVTALASAPHRRGRHGNIPL
ncbi:MAG TPA: carboxyl transferase domain-containing protein [Pilimelia sp.]|nr:carboxyl transferase domain-containing protein [Pilimelia sp.]